MERKLEDIPGSRMKRTTCDRCGQLMRVFQTETEFICTDCTGMSRACSQVSARRLEKPYPLPDEANDEN